MRCVAALPQLLPFGASSADKACISQTNIEASLKVLPIYLALTQTLLIVAGPTYHTRLWCVIEVFTFLRSTPRRGTHATRTATSPSHPLSHHARCTPLRSVDSLLHNAFIPRICSCATPRGTVGAEQSRVHVRPMLGAEAQLESNGEALHMQQLRENFSHFRVQAADCYSADKPLLLGAIETGFASLDDFNQLCSAAMVSAVDASMTKSPEVPETRSTCRIASITIRQSKESIATRHAKESTGPRLASQLLEV